MTASGGRRGRLAAFLLPLALALAMAPAGRADHRLALHASGNSLVHHPDGAPGTSMPYWLARLAGAAGHALHIGGRSGLLAEYAQPPEYRRSWDIPGTRPAWDGRGDPAHAPIDAVLFNPENFIQNRPAHRRYRFGANTETSPRDAALALLARAAPPGSNRVVYIYEGWADMGDAFGAFPPDRRALDRYLAANRGAFHDWHEAFLRILAKARPDLEFRLIPVAPILADLLTSPPFDTLPATAFFTDDAPHGTALTYALAAMISHAAIFAEPLPPDPGIGAEVSPALAAHWPEVAQAIWQAVGTLDHVAARRRAAARPPALAVGLNGIADWSTQMPFVDVMKTARPFIAHTAEAWGAYSNERLAELGLLDAAGWPTALPEGAIALESFILTDLPAAAAATTAGEYRVTWEGSGRLEIGGRARVTARRAHEIRFAFSPGDGPVAIRITATDPDRTGDYIRNIAVVRTDLVELFEVGAPFNPDFIARIRPFRTLRFMDWMQTNGATRRHWSDRPQLSDATYAMRGVPAELIAELANLTGADPWINVPHMADDDYVARLAALFHDRLAPERRLWVEFSNELWNFQFPQAKWAQAEAIRRWGAGVGEDGWMQATGLRAAEVMDIFAAEFGPQASHRLRRVIAVHTGWPGLEESLLHPANGPPEGLAAHFDAYAVAGYFGHAIGGDDDPVTADPARDREDLHRRLEAVLGAEIDRFRREELAHHARVAAEHGLALVMYEGGSHLVAHDSRWGDEALAARLAEFSYSPAMGRLYKRLLEAWHDAGGRLFNAFVDVAPPVKFGAWGHWRWLDDSNPRAAAITAANRTAPLPDDRPAEDFAGGRIIRGSERNDRLFGTPHGDVIVAGAGDDVIEVAGDGDRIHGGDGTDVAIIHASREALSFAWQGPVLVVRHPQGTAYLRSVEKLRVQP